MSFSEQKFYLVWGVLKFDVIRWKIGCMKGYTYLNSCADLDFGYL